MVLTTDLKSSSLAPLVDELESWGLNKGDGEPGSRSLSRTFCNSIESESGRELRRFCLGFIDPWSLDARFLLAILDDEDGIDEDGIDEEEGPE